MWKIMENEQFINGMWKYFVFKRAEVKKILEDAARERQEGKQGQRKCGYGMWRPKSCGKATSQKRDDSWEEFRKGCKEEEKSSAWTLEQMREACEKVAKEEIGRLGTVQENLRKSKDFLRRIIAPVGGKGGVTLSYICPHCISFSLEYYIWWVSTGHGDQKEEEEALQLGESFQGVCGPAKTL